ncbi:tRNA preQ1(34) S-adenosylmethionine ribosyltransferase-isomerase QueA [Lentilitoribacter sp. EG35]|uniref:tRNA preQ1(34) S-adenosylmethionine ribosyltransferase-isomerase QueA n=1 Tax=Lentilitoribacter sp. EG35 TaxID=3234192 RepID=UPI00345F207B
MRVDLFDFELPDECIALRPAVPREAAKFLIVRNDKEEFEDARVADFVSFLEPGDAVVFNDTRVIPAQLEGVRIRGENKLKVQSTLHMRVAGNEWKAFIRPAKRVKIGDAIIFNSGDMQLHCEVVDKADGGEVTLRFEQSGADLDAAIAQTGKVPLPPYIASKRGEDEQDKLDYQTIYAKDAGAVAAPTAGLHFTPEIFDALKAKGISCHFVTLHVGAGTFLPIKADNTDDHKMHSEIGFVTQDIADALNEVKKSGGRVVSVGTTSLRLLESAATPEGEIKPWSGPTDIFITPGYKFRAVDILMTNFHLPKSTLFMLVSAFSGFDRMRDAYKYAIDNDYRFYSYGDASLLFKAE